MCSIISDKGLAATLTSDDGCHRLLLHGPISTSGSGSAAQKTEQQVSASEQRVSGVRCDTQQHSNLVKVSTSKHDAEDI